MQEFTDTPEYIAKLKEIKQLEDTISELEMKKNELEVKNENLKMQNKQFKGSSKVASHILSVVDY